MYLLAWSRAFSACGAELGPCFCCACLFLQFHVLPLEMCICVPLHWCAWISLPIFTAFPLVSSEWCAAHQDRRQSGCQWSHPAEHAEHLPLLFRVGDPAGLWQWQHLQSRSAGHHRGDLAQALPGGECHSLYPLRSTSATLLWWPALLKMKYPWYFSWGPAETVCRNCQGALSVGFFIWSYFRKHLRPFKSLSHFTGAVLLACIACDVEMCHHLPWFLVLVISQSTETWVSLLTGCP